MHTIIKVLCPKHSDIGMFTASSDVEHIFDYVSDVSLFADGKDEPDKLITEIERLKASAASKKEHFLDKYGEMKISISEVLESESLYDIKRFLDSACGDLTVDTEFFDIEFWLADGYALDYNKRIAEHPEEFSLYTVDLHW